uniref:Protein phosphatase 1 regulatory subunit 14B n=1 Tax=Onchocerca volvulus TaxID=6282 RepID=A0A8R1TM42_ONCVO
MADNIAKHAHFSDQKNRKTNERSRMLTMKYGKHQMMLIRKRMNVENWIDNQLNELYQATTTDNIDIDLDAVLDLNTESERRHYVTDLLRKTHCPATESQIHDFLDQLMQKLNML